MAPEQARTRGRRSSPGDVFSLGSTLLFAACGHAPYRGETVMDVLVQLATEAPDLSGLPRELCGLVAAAWTRPAAAADPGRAARRSRAVVDLDAGHDLGPSLLPEAGRELIEEYRQRPQPSYGGGADQRGCTIGSQPGGAGSAGRSARPGRRVDGTRARDGFGTRLAPPAPDPHAGRVGSGSLPSSAGAPARRQAGRWWVSIGAVVAR